MRLFRFAVVVALGAAAAAACAAQPGSDPDTGSTAARAGTGGSAAPQAMTSRDDLVAPRPITWDSWRQVGPATLELTFVAGPASCEGVRVSTEETAGAVTIGLAAGSLPGGGECRAIALTTTTRVTLDRPLSDREVRRPAG